jgi:hypothetical protein
MEHGYEGLTTDQLETELTHLEQMVGVIRSRQAQLLREADRRQLPTADGSRSIIDWTAARLDVSHSTARRLNTLTHSDIEAEGLSFDRQVALTKLCQATGKPVDVEALNGYDIAGLSRKVAHHRHVTPVDERDVVAERFVAIQPTLDLSRWKLWGSLPGTDGAIVEQALVSRGDNLPSPPEGATLSRGQRSADALVSMAMDALDQPHTDQTDTRTGAMVTIVCDARDATISNGATGVSVVGGPRIGVQALEEVLCDGTVEVVAIDSDGVPLGIGPASSTIPPRVRRFVLARDGGCTVDGCHSRYRLQPHHIIQRSQGGTHHPDNLTTLCWFHHHRVIHGLGYRIDPASPPMRRRLIKPRSGTDPP